MFEKRITGSFQSEVDQINLFYVALKQKNFNSEKCIVIHHGFGEHSGRYENIINLFEDSPYSLFLLDMRGHGRSDGSRGGAPGFDAYLKDLHSFIVFLRNTYEIQKPVLLAHSLGGLIAISYCLDQDYVCDIKSLVVNGSLLHFHFTPLIFIKRIIGSVITALSPNFRMRVGLEVHHISHDPKVVAAYENDPLVHGMMGIKVANEILNKATWCIDHAAEMNIPVLFTHGGDDQISNPDGTTRFYQKCGSKDKTLNVYEKFYHEIFNELEKEKPLRDIKKWIEQRS